MVYNVAHRKCNREAESGQGRHFVSVNGIPKNLGCPSGRRKKNITIVMSQNGWTKRREHHLQTFLPYIIYVYIYIILLLLKIIVHCDIWCIGH